MFSKGITWLDDCRIPIIETDSLRNGISGRDNGKMDSNNQGWGFRKLDREAGLGRFAPNLLVCDDVLHNGIKPIRGHRGKGTVSGYGKFVGGKGEYHGKGDYVEVDSKSRYYDLDLWFEKMVEML